MKDVSSGKVTEIRHFEGNYPFCLTDKVEVCGTRQNIRLLKLVVQL